MEKEYTEPDDIELEASFEERDDFEIEREHLIEERKRKIDVYLGFKN